MAKKSSIKYTNLFFLQAIISTECRVFWPIAKAISEIADIWKRHGKIRLILSPADTSEIHQALENVTNDNERKKSTVKDSIEIAIRNLKGTRPEIIVALEEMLINDLLQVKQWFHGPVSDYFIRNSQFIT